MDSPARRHWIVWGRPRCHLCLDVYRELTQASDAGVPLDAEWRDITLDPQVFDVYRLRIPVVVDARSGRELASLRIDVTALLASVEH